ncbi:pregnancy zone protein-like [Callorhinus ursinus]|uniref:pregnancy zone protein-like n=1 Tax=Callorhinus ursinus TaxID=34884 RepID=UPI003CD001B8
MFIAYLKTDESLLAVKVLQENTCNENELEVLLEERQYVVLVPSLLYTGIPEKGCLLLSYLNETVTVSASLESLGGNQSLFTDLVVEKDLVHCISFTLPRISSSPEVAFRTVQIKGPTQDFRKKNTVLDPKRNRVAQWQSPRLESGLQQLAFPLSSEPIQGSYKVVVQKELGERIEQPFTVEEFVLPKFEVKVQVPKIISILDEKVNVSVCGIYTYGKPVPGLATVSMCRKLFHPTYCEKPEFCEKFSQQTVFTGNGTSEITNIVTRLKFVKVDSHFRQGIPFLGQVLLVDGKDVPIPNKLVFISANEANYLYSATTNDQGLVQFSINTTNVLANKISVMAYHTQPDLCFNSVWLQEEHQAAQHIAKHAFSLHGNYVHLEPMAGTLPCGQTQIIKAYYILNGKAIGEPKELIFYYLIMAKGNIVRSGTHVVPIQLRGCSFSLSFPVESDIAPIAQLFVFTVLPDGEVIGDSESFEIEKCLANKGMGLKVFTNSKIRKPQSCSMIHPPVGREGQPLMAGNVNFSVGAEAVQSPELCGNEVAEVPEIGRKDTVIKILLVEVSRSGPLQYFSETLTIVIVRNSTEISEQLSLKLPPNVVKESARASFSVLGDILGSAMQNIQNLLQMPYGCGEQNMLLFAPNIYVLNYLNETQQLTPEIKSKALGYLTSAPCYSQCPILWNTAKEGTRGSHSYTKALLAYALALVGNQDKKREILNSLDEEAVEEDNSVHWERHQKPRAPVGHFYQPPAPSAEVEMTSYVLLAYLTAQPAPTSEELTSASRIVKWITKQQNSQGGFSSTQDTVVALQALSRYGTATFTRTEKTAQVTIQNSQAFVTNFQVDDSNLLLLHQVSLPELPGEYSVTVTGDRCVYLQTSVKYNILPEKEDSSFALKVQTVPHTCDGPKVHTNFQISLSFSYTGSCSVSNMVIVDVKMVSGFIPLKPTVKMLERSSHVSRTEVSNNHVLIYVEQVTNQTLSFSFMVLQDIPVRDLKPATVKVYDYYETVLTILI